MPIPSRRAIMSALDKVLLHRWIQRLGGLYTLIQTVGLGLTAAAILGAVVLVVVRAGPIFVGVSALGVFLLVVGALLRVAQRLSLSAPVSKNAPGEARKGVEEASRKNASAPVARPLPGDRFTPPGRSRPPDPSARPPSLKADLQQALAEGQELRKAIPGRMNPQATLAYTLLGVAKTTGEDVARWRAYVETLLDKDEQRRAAFLYDPPSVTSLADRTLHGIFISPLAEEMDRRLSQLERVIRTL
jgi:hypothetical protein